MYLYLLRIHYKKIRKGLIWWWLCNFFSDFLYKGICCGYSFELHRQVDAIQMRTNNICLYKKVNKMYTGCNLKTTEFHECALIGVCAVIRSNTVCLLLRNIYLGTLFIYSFRCQDHNTRLLLSFALYKIICFFQPKVPYLPWILRQTDLSKQWQAVASDQGLHC